MSETLTCSVCGCEIDDGSYEAENEFLCEDCYYDDTFRCEGCGERFFNNHNYGDDDICLCESCRNEDYYVCVRCERLVHTDDVYWDDDEPYCSDCFVTNIDPDYTELIQYLKERRLYVNEPIDAEEEL